MSTADGIRAGLAFIELTLNDEKLVKGLKAASKHINSFGSELRTIGTGLMGLGAGIVTPVLAATKVFAEAGDQLDEMSARTGMSVEALSELKYAATVSGARIEDVEVCVRKMQKAVVSAADGSKSASEALDKLGLSAEQLSGLSPEQQFLAIAKSLKGISDPSERAAAAMAILGRSGTALLPMIQDLDELRDKAQKLGLVMSTEDAKAGGKLNDALDTVWASLRSLTLTIGGALAPLLNELAEKILVVVSNLRKWLSENKGLIISALKIGAVILAVGAAIFALGSIISTIGTIIAGLGAVISAIGTAFGFMVSIASSAFGALLTPAGLVVAAVAAIGAAIIYYSGLGGKILSWLGERFNELKAIALETWQGMAGALAAGDVVLAARILWDALKVAWLTGVLELKRLWIEFSAWYQRVTAEVFYGAASYIVDAWANVKKSWVETVSFLSDIWTIFLKGLKDAWDISQAWLQKRWLSFMGLFDKNLDVNAAVKMVDEEQAAKKNESQDQLDKSIRDSAAKANQEKGGIEENRKFLQGQIENNLVGDMGQIEADSAKSLKDAQDELDKAKEEWRAAIKEAHDKRASGEQPEAKRPNFDLALPEIENAIKRFSVVGTFSALSVDRMGIGPSGAAERTAKASEETAKNTKKLVDQMDDAELNFD